VWQAADAIDINRKLMLARREASARRGMGSFKFDGRRSRRTCRAVGAILLAISDGVLYRRAWKRRAADVVPGCRCPWLCASPASRSCCRGRLDRRRPRRRAVAEPRRVPYGAIEKPGLFKWQTSGPRTVAEFVIAGATPSRCRWLGRGAECERTDILCDSSDDEGNKLPADSSNT